MKKFLHAFNSVPGISYPALVRLWAGFHDWYFAWEKASFEQFLKAGLSEVMARRIIEWRKHFDVMKDFEWLKKRGIVFLERIDPEFPQSLINIPGPPFGLYIKGAPIKNWRPEVDGTKHLAIVGTRRSTSYGERIAKEIAQKISEQDGIIVSGLALGIDACAHIGSILAKKPTVAVLASPVDAVTPSTHAHLAEEILKYGGTLVSEYADQDFFSKHRFHERNRIISGLCQAVIVIEAPAKSGALITARTALNQGRDLYVLPGDITRPQNEGSLGLIADGANPIISVDRLLVDLGFNSSREVAQQNLTIEEMLILKIIQKKAVTTEEIFREATRECAESGDESGRIDGQKACGRATGLSINKIQALLTSLDLKGIIQKNKMAEWEFTPQSW